MLGDFFSEFIFSGESISEDVWRFLFCSGESIPFRRCSKKVFFEDFCFVLENQSHSEDARRKFSLKIFVLFWRINPIQKMP
jgi:hypothetical protein